MEVALSVLGQLRNLEDARSVLRGLRELVALGSAGEASAADLSRLSHAGAPQHLLLALERHIGNPEIQKVGCAALAVLVGNRPAVATWVISLGAVQTIRASTRAFAADAALALQASRALLAVTSAHALSGAPSLTPAAMGASLDEPHRADAADILLGVLERDPCDSAVALSCCKALCHVVAEAEAARAAAAALAALYVHRKDALMCRVCCRLIHILCATSQRSRSRVLATTAVQDVAAVLRRHPSRLEVVTEACAALEQLGAGVPASQHSDAAAAGSASGSPVAAQFFRGGVYPSLLRVMHRHSHFATLTASGCNVIALCADADQATKDRILPGERGAAAVVVNALVRHSSAQAPDSDSSVAMSAVDDATVCLVAAQAVVALALNSPLAQASLGEAGAIAALLSALRVHRDHSTACCHVVVAALSALCSDCVSNVESLHRQDGVEQVIRAARYTGDSALRTEACRALPAWCETGSGENGIGDWRCTSTGSAALSLACGLLQSAVAQDIVDPKQQQHQGKQQHEPEPEPEPELEPEPEQSAEPEPEAEPMPELKMQAHISELQEERRLEVVDACCRALEALLQEETLRSLALAQGVLRLCIVAMRAHAKRAWVCVSVCRALVGVLGDRDEQTQKSLREEGGLKLLVDLLRGGEYVLEPRLDSASLRALLAATSGYTSEAKKLTHHGVNARALFRLGVVAALYRLLIVEARGGLERSAQLSLKLLVNLALEADPDEIHAMNEMGLIHATFHSMQRHATSGKLLGLSCRALVLLEFDLFEQHQVSQGDPRERQLTRSAALQLLRQALSLPHHQGDHRLQKYGAQILRWHKSAEQERLVSVEDESVAVAKVEEAEPPDPAAGPAPALEPAPVPALEPEPEPEPEPQ